MKGQRSDATVTPVTTAFFHFHFFLTECVKNVTIIKHNGKDRERNYRFLSKSQITMLYHKHLISFSFPDKHLDFLSLYKSFQTNPHSTGHRKTCAFQNTCAHVDRAIPQKTPKTLNIVASDKGNARVCYQLHMLLFIFALVD